MNILLDKLPIEYDGCKINSDFRVMILFELLMQDDDLSLEEKLEQSLNNFYVTIPTDIVSALEYLLNFYKCFRENEPKPSKSNNSERAYCFSQDADLIYSAFMSEYGIDLQDVPYLHWWKFKAMLMGLSENNQIVKIMGYRTADLKGMTKEQKQFYKKMKDFYRLKSPICADKLSLQARDKTMIDYVNKRFGEVYE